MSIFKDKTLLITGGTGSFGNAVLNRFLRTDIGEIRIFSRDEKKQDDMRHEYQVKFPDVAQTVVDGFNTLIHSLQKSTKIEKYFIWYTFGTYF